jgi:mannose-6-phosphate isomerase-like protein (cupin superfamily)
LADAADLPFTLHRTQIDEDARTHYHRQLTETYFVLECGPEARLELDGESVALRPGIAVVIRPGVRHRAVGKLTVLILVWPKFDPADEWFD